MIEFLSNIILCGLSFLFGSLYMRENYLGIIQELQRENEALKSR